MYFLFFYFQLYDKALELVEACQDAVKEVSFRLSKQLRLEVTRLELLKLDAAGLQGISSLSPESREDAIKKAKSCSSVNLAETGDPFVLLNHLLLFFHLFNLFKPEFTFVIFLYYKSRIAIT